MDLEIIYKNEDKALTEVLQDLAIPRKIRHFLRTRKDVYVNGSQVPFHTVIKAGDRLQLHFTEADYPTYHVEAYPACPVHIAYEDEHLLVVDKPVGIKTHPNAPDEKTTMLNAVAFYLQEKKENAQPYVVHRLDKETSGLLLFAKNPVVLPLLGRQLETKTMERTYEAIAQGKIKQAFSCTQAIGRDRHDKRKRCVCKNGQAALTEVLPLKAEGTNTRIECHLHSGRTHQIRVHLAFCGHPLLGDPLYGQKKDRLYLHAKSLRLQHPLTQKSLVIHSSVPF